jgi:Ni,Fe-hydrogenase III small subunit/ferredoxin
VSPWVLRGLRNGVVTTRWPARPDQYAIEWRGPATIRYPGPRAHDDLALLCPTKAIGSRPDGMLRLDQGRCILCGQCVARRPDVFEWSAGPAAASLTREGLVVPEIPDTDANLAAVRDGLRARTAALRRSVHLRHVDAGSDGAVEQEIQALLNPVYDVHRLGIFFTASPRHADVLLVTGAGARGMTAPLRRTYDGMPDPKIVVAVGTDAVSGGLVSPSYATTGGVGGTVPVNVWLPGAPPSPFSILHALLLALGRLPGGGKPGGRESGGGRRDRGEDR